ncbi:hypothetical protein [Streptomyces sp. NRAIS3]
MSAERAARALVVHAQAVREPVLDRRLSVGGTDLYEVVLAHLVTGELPVPDLGVPGLGVANPGQSDSAVHR